MRLANAQGGLEFSFKDALDDPMPEGFKPWFEYPSLAAQTHQIVFGHWAALQGQTVADNIQNVDGGCVWAISSWRIVWKISNCLQWIIRWQNGNNTLSL